MKIKFHETLYNLITEPYIYQTRFQCEIEKGENTYDSIIEDTVNPTEITVYNDEDEVIGVYTDFNKRIAITIMENVSIELENINLAQQIQDLTNSVSQQQTYIDTLNEQVSELTPYTDTAKAYYNESEKTFYNVPDGNITVFFDNYSGEYTVNRVSDRVTISFEPLTQDTNITISII